MVQHTIAMGLENRILNRKEYSKLRCIDIYSIVHIGKICLVMNR